MRERLFSVLTDKHFLNLRERITDALTAERPMCGKSGLVEDRLIFTVITHSFNKYLYNIYFVLDTVLGTMERAMNKTDQDSYSFGKFENEAYSALFS